MQYAGRDVFSLILIKGGTSKIEFNCNACGKNFQMRWKINVLNTHKIMQDPAHFLLMTLCHHLTCFNCWLAFDLCSLCCVDMWVLQKKLGWCVWTQCCIIIINGSSVNCILMWVGGAATPWPGSPHHSQTCIYINNFHLGTIFQKLSI